MITCKTGRSFPSKWWGNSLAIWRDRSQYWFKQWFVAWTKVDSLLQHHQWGSVAPETSFTESAQNISEKNDSMQTVLDRISAQFCIESIVAQFWHIMAFFWHQHPPSSVAFWCILKAHLCHLWPGDMFCKQFVGSQSKSCKNKCCSFMKNNDEIRSQFCTCANLWPPDWAMQV